MKTKIKKVSDTYLYGKGEYEKNLYKSFIQSEVIDKNDPSLEDIRYDVRKAQDVNVLLKVFDSNNVVFLINKTPLPRAFKVFAASDIKSGDKKIKVFIDMTDVIHFQNGKYELRPRDLDKLLSYLTTALGYLIYYANPDLLINNSRLLDTGTKAFAELFAYCIDTLRIGSVDKVREKCLYLGAMYYQLNILCKENTDSIEARAKKISGLTTREVEMIDMLLNKDTFDNINGFINSVSKVLKSEGLKLDNFIEKWIFVFGSGTQFATELYPAFSSLLTNAYNGAYLNNQKAIEKVLGKTLVEYTTALLKKGSELA